MVFMSNSPSIGPVLADEGWGANSAPVGMAMRLQGRGGILTAHWILSVWRRCSMVTSFMVYVWRTSHSTYYAVRLQGQRKA